MKTPSLHIAQLSDMVIQRTIQILTDNVNFHRIVSVDTVPQFMFSSAVGLDFKIPHYIISDAWTLPSIFKKKAVIIRAEYRGELANSHAMNLTVMVTMFSSSLGDIDDIQANLSAIARVRADEQIRSAGILPELANIIAQYAIGEEIESSLDALSESLKRIEPQKNESASTHMNPANGPIAKDNGDC